MKNNLDDIRNLFNSLTSQLGKQKRTETLLKSPHGDSPSEWFMYIPPFFNNALDIRDTERKKDKISYWVWTQGADFSFSVGDIIYDTKYAYNPWSEALKKIKICIQVTKAVSASSSEAGFRFPGRISFDLFFPDPSKEKLQKVSEFEMSQYEFVSLLIFGPSADLATAIYKSSN